MNSEAERFLIFQSKEICKNYSSQSTFLDSAFLSIPPSSTTIQRNNNSTTPLDIQSHNPLPIDLNPLPTSNIPLPNRFPLRQFIIITISIPSDSRNSITPISDQSMHRTTSTTSR